MPLFEKAFVRSSRRIHLHGPIPSINREPSSIRLFRSPGGALMSTKSSQNDIRVAVLYQATEAPIINGVRKPAKPGGYRDSGADIAYNLQSHPDTTVLTSTASSDPEIDSHWSYPDTESGILEALQNGATHLWANTVLFASHPLQTSAKVKAYQDAVRVVGQPPTLVELYDDKRFVNDFLRRRGGFTLPGAWIIDENSENGKGDWRARVKELELPYPVVGKPIRGRGSHGVKVCASEEELTNHLNALFMESPSAMVEEYLSGEEATVTVMPPSSSPSTSESHSNYWALPVVTRFNHLDGIAPYNGVVAVSRNSRAVTDAEYRADTSYEDISRQCCNVAKLLKLTAPSRIDVRRFKEGSKFALFDVNMKPNMTGPGRPGRDDQQSLTAIAASALGWDYPRLLLEMLNSASSLRDLRHITPDVVSLDGVE